MEKVRDGKGTEGEREGKGRTEGRGLGKWNLGGRVCVFGFRG